MVVMSGSGYDFATNWTLHLAQAGDIPALEELIPLSARSLLAQHLLSGPDRAAFGPVFGVDRQLIKDGTYFVAAQQGQVLGCGGWSRRRSLFGRRYRQKN